MERFERPAFLNPQRILAGLISALTVTLAQPLIASADTTQSFQISPPTANYAADPGAQSRGIIKVTNLTGSPLTIKTGKQNFVAKGEEGEIELVDNANPLYSLAPWFTITESSFTIPARATKEVHYAISVPAAAEPGGRYGSLIFSSVPPQLPAGVSGATVQQTIAAVIFERINGQAQEHLEVASFATEQSFYEAGPVKFLTRLKNTGNVHEKATGTITIKNLFGLTVATIPLDEHFVIPDAIRRLHNTWPSANQHPWLVGPYTAMLSATYGQQERLTATTHFTVFPTKTALIVLAGLIVLFIIFWRGRKRLRRAARILAGRE